MWYAGNYKYLTYASGLLAGISAVTALVPFYCLWLIIKEVLEVAPDFSKAEHIVSNGWTAVAFAAASFILYIAGLMCLHYSAFRVQANIRKELSRHILSLPLGAVERRGSGKVRKTVNECSAATETYLAHQLPDTVVAYITPLCLVVMLFAFDWRFGLICLIPIALSFIIMMTQMTGPVLKTKMDEYQNALANMSNEAVEYVRGIPVVKTFGQSVFSFRRFKDSIDRYSEWATAYTKSLRVPMAILTTLVNGIFAFILLAGVWFATGGITANLILNVLFYIIITPIITVTMTKIMFQSENKMIVADSLKRIDDILSLSPLSSNGDEIPADNSVTVKNVSFSYDGKNKAIDDVSLEIGEGKTVAFVGPSGGGKTTVSILAARFWDASSGKITVGGTDVSTVDPEALLSVYSIVFQDVTLFNNSIKENIRLGKKDATDEEVYAAAKLANCDEFAEKLPNGYDTDIGENGCRLSGGERQRISIARAFLKNAPIILLDEATASLDVENETLIQTALSRLIKDKTVIVIAHRMRTVEGAYKIVVLEDGKVKEEGNAEKLISENGIFADMVKKQTESGSWSIA